MNASTRKAFAEDGAVLIEKFLDAEQLARCRAVFDWCVENPGPLAVELFAGTEKETYNENANPGAAERLNQLVSSIPFDELFADLWGSKNVWYFAEEVFLKKNGKGGRTPWHQDTSYLPWDGMHWCNAWISFEAVPKPNSLEMIKGSHRGILHDGTNFLDANDPTAPLHGGSTLPRLPDICPGLPNRETSSSFILGCCTAGHRSMRRSGIATPWSCASSAMILFFDRCRAIATAATRQPGSCSRSNLGICGMVTHFRASCFRQLR
ncbi:MAG: phytanoyl-CoA dioxygenase family protein [Candidatus Binatus sp.]